MDVETGHYKTPGALIREAREAKGISLEELATESRISERMLGALEADNYAQLNGPLYVKSFLRTCSEFLDLDVDLLLKHYELMGKEEEPEVIGGDIWQREETHIHRVQSFSRRWLLRIAGALLLIVVIVVALRIFTGGEADQPVAGSDVAPGDSGPVVEAEIEGGDSRVDSGPDPVPERSTVTPTVETRTGARPESGPPPETSVEPEAVVQPDQRVLDAMEALPAGDRSLVFSGNRSWPLVLRLTFTRPTAYAIATDQQGETRAVDWPADAVLGVPEDEIVPGRHYTVGSTHVVYWGANDHFLLKLDSAESVTVSLNGRVLPIPTRIVGREWVLDGTMVGR